MGKARIPASLNGIEFDCIVNRSRKYTADAPEYPVEKGFKVSDTLQRKPVTLDVTIFNTDMPVTWKVRHSGKSRMREVEDALLDLFMSNQIVTFVTTDRVYENMVITSLTIPEGEYLNAREISLSLKQITVTSKVTISEDYDQSGATGENAGSTATYDEEMGESILHSLLSGVLDKFFGG